VILTIYAVGMALERNPQATETMARQGCYVVDHGWRWLDYHGIDEVTEERVTPSQGDWSLNLSRSDSQELLGSFSED
jgi:peptidoglycan/xylan/chitin deacetylase (PgdA/CDA1 family)